MVTVKVYCCSTEGSSASKDVPVDSLTTVRDVCDALNNNPWSSSMSPPTTSSSYNLFMVIPGNHQIFQKKLDMEQNVLELYAFGGGSTFTLVYQPSQHEQQLNNYDTTQYNNNNKEQTEHKADTEGDYAHEDRDSNNSNNTNDRRTSTTTQQHRVSDSDNNADGNDNNNKPSSTASLLRPLDDIRTAPPPVVLSDTNRSYFASSKLSSSSLVSGQTETRQMSMLVEVSNVKRTTRGGRGLWRMNELSDTTTTTWRHVGGGGDKGAAEDRMKAVRWGVLEKASHSKPVWKPRMVVLRGDALWYAKTPGTHPHIVTPSWICIPLRQCTQLGEVFEDKRVFCCSSTSPRRYCWRAKSSNERDGWVLAVASERHACVLAYTVRLLCRHTLVITCYPAHSKSTL
eukprot:GHVS01037383.1.p1 GENE.GHVS01037383.1~~GHVS01037383.1.p1  ORF type:complete len:399 (-),score=83.25 GHVS01037383.1:295-1491(-)